MAVLMLLKEEKWESWSGCRMRNGSVCVADGGRVRLLVLLKKGEWDLWCY